MLHDSRHGQNIYDDGAVHAVMILASYVRAEQQQGLLRGSSYLQPIECPFYRAS
jgi:hypothetical protein